MAGRPVRHQAALLEWLEDRMEHERNLFVSLAAVLLGFGTLMVHSASITSWPTEFEQVYLSRHLIFVLIGVCLAAASACVPASVWYRAAPLLFLGTVVLLVLVLLPGIGTRINGAQRWFRYGPLSFQPSELAKLTLPLFLSYLATRLRAHLNGWVGGTLPLIFPVAVVMVLVAKQPDLGTTLFLAAGGGMVLWIAGWPLRNFVLGAAVVVPAFGCLVAMKPYQIRRITGFLATWSDLSEAPYQLKQSLVTLGAGGSFGVGLGRGWQKLSFLPEANTDFVFAVVGEELGLVGTLGVVALWCGLYAAGLRLLRSCREDPFAYAAGFTLLSQLVLQAALNVAVVTAMVPPKGIPHPLLSYGGSSLVVSLMSLGVIVALAQNHAREV